MSIMNHRGHNSAEAKFLGIDPDTLRREEDDGAPEYVLD